MLFMIHGSNSLYVQLMRHLLPGEGRQCCQCAQPWDVHSFWALKSKCVRVFDTQIHKLSFMTVLFFTFIVNWNEEAHNVSVELTRSGCMTGCYGLLQRKQNQLMKIQSGCLYCFLATVKCNSYLCVWWRPQIFKTRMTLLTNSLLRIE